ncbi:hypothetical protein C4571_00980 [Candidatus Parcubacteria bacterium]|nr:MAG: hypothetical protein C4571_00980 [Candidatus Parcubacteria bacterium]
MPFFFYAKKIIIFFATAGSLAGASGLAFWFSRSYRRCQKLGFCEAKFWRRDAGALHSLEVERRRF